LHRRFSARVTPKPSDTLKNRTIQPIAALSGRFFYGVSIMDKVKAFFSHFAAPLEWLAGKVAAYPKGTLIVWAVSLALVRFI